MIKQRPSVLLMLGTAAITMAFLSIATCTSGSYEILPVADLQISPSDECKIPDAVRSYSPSSGSLIYSSNSDCKPGQLICRRDRYGLLRWMPLSEPFAPSDLGVESCNGKDDDCNGIIDDAPGINSICDNGKSGYCKTLGSKQCGVDAGTATCNAPSKSPQNPQAYYTYPYLDNQGNPGWDWDCSGTTEIVFCLQSSLTQGYIINPSAAVCNPSAWVLLNNYIPSSFTNPMCSGCATAGLVIPMWGKSVVTISNNPTPSDCGKSMPFVNCSYNGTQCAAIGSDTIVVSCK